MDKKKALKELEAELAKLLSGKTQDEPKKYLAKEVVDIISIPSSIKKIKGTKKTIEQLKKAFKKKQGVLSEAAKRKKRIEGTLGEGPKKKSDLLPVNSSKDISEKIQRMLKRKDVVNKVGPGQKKIRNTLDAIGDIKSTTHAQSFGKACTLEQYKTVQKEIKKLKMRQGLYNDKSMVESLRKKELLLKEAARTYEKNNLRMPKKLDFWKIED